MSRKRTTLPDAFRAKRSRPAVENSGDAELWGADGADLPIDEVPNDTEAALRYLADLFPRKLFEDRLPPIVLQHQLYSVLSDRTAADRQLNELRERGKVCVFALGVGEQTSAVVFRADFEERVRAAARGRPWEAVAVRFLDEVVGAAQGPAVSCARLLHDLSFRDADITRLVNGGLLTVRDVGSWWLSIPGLGKFIKHLTRGRKAVLAAIRKSRCGELLQADLEARTMRTAGQLGLPYLVHDAVGAQAVKRIVTTTGALLRVENE